jgi:autotransporter passenger strand-loop-strand repeat protein
VVDSWLVSAGGALVGPGNLVGGNAVAGEVDGVTVGTNTSHGGLILLSGATASGVTVSGAGPVYPPDSFQVDAGAVASATTIANRAVAYVYGSAFRDAIQSASLTVEKHGLTSGDIVGSRGVEAVQTGAVARGATVQLGGELSVASAGKALSASVERGGILVLADGAAATGTTVAGGGRVYLNTVISGDFDAGRISSAVVVSGATISSAAVIDFDSVTVLSGASLSLASRGWVGGLTVSADGLVSGVGQVVGNVSVAGEVEGLLFGGSHGDVQVDVTSGGSASAVSIIGHLPTYGGVYDDSLRVEAGATLTSAYVANGAAVFVRGSAADTFVSSGFDFVISGGLDRGATLAASSTEYVLTGGLAVGATVENGAQQVVSSGGVVSGTWVENGGVLSVLLGGATSASTVLSGGVVDYGGRLSHDFTAGSIAARAVLSGLTLSSGAKVNLVAAEILSGADVTFAPDAEGVDLRVFAGGALLGSESLLGTTVVAGVVSGALIGDLTGSVGATLSLASGGVASNVTVSGGDIYRAYNYSQFEANVLAVAGGGVVNGATIEDLAIANIYGAATGDIVASATVDVWSGGRTSGSILSAGGVETVEFKGSAAGEVVLGGASLIVNLSGVASGAVVSSGGLLVVSSGGSARGSTVESGGIVFLNDDITASFSAGVVAATTVVDGVTLLSGADVELLAALVASGATLSLPAASVVNPVSVALGGAVVGSGSLLGLNFDNGVVSGATIGKIGTTSGAALLVGSDGLAEGVDVVTPSGYGYGYYSGYYHYYGFGLTVAHGGTVSDAVIGAGAQALISGAAVGDRLDGGSQYVSSGASVASTTVGGGGTQVVFFGGHAVSTTVASGGIDSVWSGGKDLDMVVQNGGRLFLIDGGDANGAHIHRGGSLFLSAARIANDTTVGAVAATTVVSGVTLSSGAFLGLLDVTVLGGRTVTLASGGAAASLRVLSGAVISGPGTLFGSNTIAGIVSGATLGSGGSSNDQLMLATSASISDITVSGVRDYIGVGYLAKAARVTLRGANDVLYVGHGGQATGAIIDAGSAVVVGVAVGTVIGSGAAEVLDRYGAGVGATVLRGGTLEGDGGGSTLVGVTTVSSGGAIERTAIGSGGVVRLSAGAVASGLLFRSGSELDLLGGTIGNGQTVTAGVATLNERAPGASLSAGATVTVSGVTVTSGGVVAAGKGGVASSVVVGLGGTESVLSGGVAQSAQVHSGGVMKLAAGGGLSGVVISGGGELDLVGLTAGAAVTLLAKGVAAPQMFSGAKLLRGAAIDLVGASLFSGGVAIVDSGGVATDAAVAGGSLYVRAGGAADGVAITSGGRAVVSAGGGAADLAMHTGGRLLDNGTVTLASAQTWGGELAGTGDLVVTGSASVLLRDAGSGFHGVLALGDGSVELAHSAAIGDAAVLFEPTTGSATLQVDTAAHGLSPGGTFANLLSNFSGAFDRIDLAGVAFASGATASIAGSQLVLTDGGSRYAFNVAGTVAAGYQVATDGRGGTLITASPAQTAARVAQVMASAVPAHGAAIASPSSAGGASPMLALVTHSAAVR